MLTVSYTMMMDHTTRLRNACNEKNLTDELRAARRGGAHDIRAAQLICVYAIMYVYVT